MNKKLVTIVFVLLLICVGLSGCNEQSKTLVDGTEVTGDVDQIQIIEYELIKYQYLSCTRRIESQEEKWATTLKTEVRYGSVNISGFNTNLSKRKYICENYLESGISFYGEIKWDSDYWGYTLNYHYVIYDINLESEVSSWRVKGSAKNIGNDFLDYPRIIVNYYNSDGSWLAKSSDSEDNIPSGYTWNFDMKYNGEFKNDVDYISFEVDANPYG